MNSALQGTDPVIYFESQRIYDIGEHFHEGGVPEGYYEIPLGNLILNGRVMILQFLPLEPHCTGRLMQPKYLKRNMDYRPK
jgi:hypothetical protein